MSKKERRFKVLKDVKVSHYKLDGPLFKKDEILTIEEIKERRKIVKTYKGKLSLDANVFMKNFQEITPTEDILDLLDKIKWNVEDMIEESWDTQRNIAEEIDKLIKEIKEEVEND